MELLVASKRWEGEEAKRISGCVADRGTGTRANAELSQGGAGEELASVSVIVTERGLVDLENLNAMFRL